MKIAGEKLKTWWDCFIANRKLTYDLVEALREEDLARKLDRPGLDTPAKQVQEMVSVQEAFGVALISGVMDFSSVPDVDKFSGPKKPRLLALLKDADRRFEELLTGEVQSSVRWDEMALAPEVHMCNLISHEVFHQGQLALASYIYGVALPESWTYNWALPRAAATRAAG